MTKELLKILFLAFITFSNASYPENFIGKGFTSRLQTSDTVEQKTFRNLDPSFRLPNEVIPVHYDLKLRPILDNLPGDFTQWTAPGSVTILVNCVQNTTNITLHSEVTSINTNLVKVSTSLFIYIQTL